jgi:anti-anti-sigma regulatory factor
LRITIHQNPESVEIKLEGRIAGPWAAELGNTWNDLAPGLKKRSVSLDISGVTYMDAEGSQLLKDMCQSAEISFLTNSPLTEYFAEEAMRSATNSKEAV